MIKAVIFDMDGTMIDSEMLHFNAYQKALAVFSIAFAKEDYWRIWGSDKEMCQRIVLEKNLEVSWEKLLESKNKIFRQESLSKVKAKEGLLALLEKLSQDKYIIAVASGSQMEEIKQILSNLSIGHYFGAIISGELVEHNKPAPDIFLLAAEKLKIDPAYCLVLEDSPKGVVAAKQAGMTCYAIPNREVKDKDFTSADKILDNLSDVYSCIKKEF